MVDYPTATAARDEMFGVLSGLAPDMVDEWRRMTGAQLRQALNQHFNMAIPNQDAMAYFRAVTDALRNGRPRSKPDDIWDAVRGFSRG